MGIMAAIDGIASVASAASTVSGMVGGSTGSMLNSAVGTGISAAAQAQAGSIQKDAAQQALDKQLAMNQQVGGEYNPFLAMNAPVTQGLDNLLGVGPSGPAGMLTQLQQTPGYQFQLQQGTQQALSQLSAMGLAKSGSAIKGVTNYAEGLAGTTYQNMVSNFMNAGQLGLRGTDSYASTMMSGQNSVNNLLLQRGAAEASGIVGSANVLNGGLNNLNALNPNNGLNPIAPAQNYSGNPLGVATSQMLMNDPNGYTTNNIAMQNPYQIQIPQSVQNYQPEITPFTPTLPSG
jgi:hypothetical protein